MSDKNEFGQERPVASFFDSYAFPKNGFPPTSKYRAWINKIVVSKSKKTGTYCFDACYEIWDEEFAYFIKQRIAVGMPALNNLLDACESGGVQIDEFEIEGMGDVTLDINLSYDKDGCAKIIYLDDSEEV